LPIASSRARWKWKRICLQECRNKNDESSGNSFVINLN
jgi:hypothetical protein